MHAWHIHAVEYEYKCAISGTIYMLNWKRLYNYVAFIAQSNRG